MFKTSPVALMAVVAMMTVSAPVSAQGRSTASSATLDAAVASRPSTSRAAVNAALSSPQALQTARSMGLSADQVATRIAALDDNALQQLNDRLLAGGSSSVVISTTAIIIVLLILILLTR